MTYVQSPGAGHRRFDTGAARADHLARAFNGLPEAVNNRQVLTALKRAAPYLGVSPRLVHAIDTLMAWSKPIDWSPGERPIVFPSNETLAQKLGVGVRQVQKLLDRAVAEGLISHRDSANGNRIGARGKDGRLIYAYGIDLSPLGARLAEFVETASRGSAEDARLDVLRKRLTGARRKIRSLAQAVIDASLTEVDADLPLEVAQLATRQMRLVRDETLLGCCVEQMEERAAALAAAVRVAMSSREGVEISKDDSPSDESEAMLITTTKQNQSAKAEYSRGYSTKSSSGYDVRVVGPQTEVEADLENHGVDPAFIANVAPEICSGASGEHPAWGDLVVMAERLVGQTGIHRAAWHEACRLMGQKGAAASVIATTCKHLRGDVDRPGAYLRGMNTRAAAGELNLGRTFHGLKDAGRVAGMKSLHDGSDPRSVGQLVASALRGNGSGLLGRLI